MRRRQSGFAWPAWGIVRARCVPRGRRGEFRDVVSADIVLRGMLRESGVPREMARFRGPVRECGCIDVFWGRKVVAGAGNPLICGCDLVAGVSQNAMGGCVASAWDDDVLREMQWEAGSSGAFESEVFWLDGVLLLGLLFMVCVLFPIGSRVWYSAGFYGIFWFVWALGL